MPDVGFSGWTTIGGVDFAPCWKQKLFQFDGIKLYNDYKCKAIGTVLPQVLEQCWLNILRIFSSNIYICHAASTGLMINGNTFSLLPAGPASLGFTFADSPQVPRTKVSSWMDGTPSQPGPPHFTSDLYTAAISKIKPHVGRDQWQLRTG